VQIDERNIEAPPGQPAPPRPTRTRKKRFAAEVAYINPGVDRAARHAGSEAARLEPPQYLRQDMTVSVDTRWRAAPARWRFPPKRVRDATGASPWSSGWRMEE
jgi:HlyD family secretion protein